MGKCPSSIVAIEIGSEPISSGSWSAQQTQYEKFATSILAIQGARSLARVAPPDLTHRSAFHLPTPESAKYGSKLTLLTQHSYVAGAGTASATAANLRQ